MNVLLFEHYTCVFIIFVYTFRLIQTSTSTEYPSTTISGDFESFLQGLGLMVYKYKKPARGSARRRGFEYTTTQRSKNTRTNENLLKTQKEALRDVLMMKLVSYYEDKYKITHQEKQDILLSPTTARAVPFDNNENGIGTFIQRPTTVRVRITKQPDYQYSKFSGVDEVVVM